MNIGELFVNLGIKGAEKTLSALGNARKGMSELGSASIETKAAILGAMYGLERMMQNSATAGTQLSNFTALTGQSAKSLQQWQYAAKIAGSSAEEMQGSFQSVYDTMGKVALGEGLPKGFSYVETLTHMDPEKAKKNTFYLFEQLRKYAKEAPANAVSNAALKSFGLTDNIIALMRRGKFDPAVLNSAPVRTDKQIKALDNVHTQMEKLEVKLSRMFDNFTVKHGAELVHDISEITTGVMKLGDALMIVAERFKLFKIPKDAIEGWEKMFRAIGDIVNDPTLGKDIVGGAKEAFKYDAAGVGNNQDFTDHELEKRINQRINRTRPAITPTPSPLRKSEASPQIFNIDQNLIFHHDGKDHKKTGDSVKKANQASFRQIDTIGRVT